MQTSAEIAGRIAPATQTRITFSVGAAPFARWPGSDRRRARWIEEEIGADKADKQMWTYGLAWAQMRGAARRSRSAPPAAPTTAPAHGRRSIRQQNGTRPPAILTACRAGRCAFDLAIDLNYQVFATHCRARQTTPKTEAPPPHSAGIAPGAILDAENAPDDAGQKISRADLEKAELEGLQDPASLTIFLTWYQLGGVQRRIEAAEMPALRNDIFYLLREMNRMGNAARAPKPQPNSAAPPRKGAK